MAYPTLDTSYNITGDFSEILPYLNEVTNNLFSSMFLIAVFCISCLGSYFATRSSQGRGDFPASFAVAGFVTAILSLILYLKLGVVSLLEVTVTISICIIGVLWLFLSRDRE